MTYKPSAELITKHALYLDLLPYAQDESGFIETGRCDSTLFSGLLGSVPGTRVNLYEAMMSPGKWYRRSLQHGECYTMGGATSEISRDMLVGCAWWSWCNKRADITEGICDYATKYFGVMGKGKLSQTLMTPSLLNTFANISWKLGGKSYPLLRLLPCYISPNLKDYQRHLAVLHALLRLRMDLKINDSVFYKAILAQPNNPLFSYACAAAGDVNDIFAKTTENQLMNSHFWPSDRLPTSLDRREPWLLQRDYGDDWQPEDGLVATSDTHSGADFLFVSALLQGLI